MTRRRNGRTLHGMSDVLRGTKTSLRPMTRDDMQVLHRWLNDPDVMQHWDGRDHPATFDRVEVRFRKSVEGTDRETHRYMIEVDGRAIGMVQHGRINPRARHAQVDLLIGESSFRDTGYGADAMLAILHHLFESQRAHRVWLTLRASNVQAIRSAEKCGFQREGLLREHDQLEGSMVDVLVFGLLSREWKARTESASHKP
ncbi:MAG: GNAT family N-acetyltransferase [Polyangiales bacterium]